MNKTEVIGNTKYCNKCGTALTFENTYNSVMLNGAHICKQCWNRSVKECRSNNQDKRRKYRRVQYEKEKAAKYESFLKNKMPVSQNNLSEYVGENVYVEHVRADGMPVIHHGKVRSVKMYLHLEIANRNIYKIPVKAIKSISEVRE